VRIGCLVVGTRGEWQPMLALAAGLQRRGHEPVFFSWQPLDELVRSLGFGFVRLELEGAKADISGFNEGQRADLRRPSAALARRFCDQLREKLRGVDAIICTSYHDALALSVAEALGVPCSVAWFWPGVPTAASLAPLWETLPWRLPLTSPWINLRSHRLAGIANYFGQQQAVRYLRRKLALPPAPWLGPAQERFAALFCAVSAAVVPRPPDWPSNAHLTGYWFGRQIEAAIDPDLAEFVARGDPPLYLGLGSTLPPRLESTAAALLEAIQATGHRAVVAGALARALPGARPGVFLAEEVDHGWLFPRTAGVLCHGGAGTVAAALRAGVPVMAVPVSLDQLYWGRRLIDLGVAPEVIPLYELRRADLRQAIRALVGGEHRRRAGALAAQMSVEDGVNATVDILERR
jgi:UDP:flavonoid glycosyltransferase YjiC (YdhE family)